MQSRTFSSPSLLAFAVAMALPFAAQAQEATDLDEVVVSGTRTEVAVEDSLVPAQVIGRDAIQRSQARSLGELLQQGKSNLQAPWLGISGFFVIALMLSLLNFIGEAVRDAFDPRKTFA